MKLNTRERVLSTDHNRLQSFLGADIALMLARSYLAKDLTDSGDTDLSTTVDTPLTALILDGLMFSPIDGSTSALVTAGSVLMVDPDGVSPDDNPYKWVNSDGIVAIGQLVLTPNPGGVRIDVVEFRRTTEDVELDNRDTFDPTTGLFTPVLVTKVQRGTLEFRIRLGVVGLSFPGTASGWLPIAVCRIPAVAATWDDVTVWDVRPLLADRHNTTNTFAALPSIVRQNVKTDIPTMVAALGLTVRISGIVESVLNETRVGGIIRSCVPGTQVDFIEITNTANQEGGGAIFVASRFWYLYQLFPYNLPRWVRYSDPGLGGRVPNGQRGMSVVSVTPPNFDGTPTAKIAPPGSTNLQNGTYMAVGTHPAACIAVGRVSAGAIPLGVFVDGEVTRPVHNDFGSAQAGVIYGGFTRYTLVSGVDFPENAKSVNVMFKALVTAINNVFVKYVSRVEISDASGLSTNVAYIIWPEMPTTTYLLTAAVVELRFEVRLQLEPQFTGVNRTFNLEWLHDDFVGTTMTLRTAEVMSWYL